MPGTKYQQDEIILQKGDVLFLYTDGVTEAENQKKEQFTDKRLKDIANKCDLVSVKELLNFTRNIVDEFADGAEQFDDITMLALMVE